MRNTKLLSMVTIALLAGMMIVAGCGGKKDETGKKDKKPVSVAKACTCSIGDGACELHGKKGAPKPKTGENTPELKMVPLDSPLPKALFQGTPMQSNEPNIAKGRPRGVQRPVIYVPEGAVNLARDKPVTSNEPQPTGDLEMVTNGDKLGTSGHHVNIHWGKKWVQIDLELQANIYGIWIWHYHEQARAYRDVIVEVSDDKDFKPENVTTVYNSDHDDSYYDKGTKGGDLGYIETNEGHYIHCPEGTTGRYVRLHSQGNTFDDNNHYIEVEVYGIPVK